MERERSSWLVTNFVVISEVVALLSPSFRTAFLGWAIGALDIDQDVAADLPRVIDLMDKYADLPADFADASLVALCERRGIREVATLDHDFDVYRAADRKRLHNFFFAG